MHKYCIIDTYNKNFCTGIRRCFVMSSIQSKKMLPMNILNILKKYSDEEHRLDQKQISDFLGKEYDIYVDRKTIKRTLMNLIEFGYRIEYDETSRKNRYGNEEVIYSNWYLEREYSPAEIRLLTDSLLFSKYASRNQCKELIDKLENLNSPFAQSSNKHIGSVSEIRPANKELFLNIEILDEAIVKRKQVSFYYNQYDIDKKMYPKLDSDGKPKQYCVNPVQIVVVNNRYYLIGNFDKYDNISHYRLDRMTNIQLTKTPAKPLKEIEEMKQGLNVEKHVSEHIYMFSGKSERVSFRAQRHLVSEIIDWFGMTVIFSNVSAVEITVSVMVNERAMRYWAMQYALYITVLSPQSLVDKIIEDIHTIQKNYESG